MRIFLATTLCLLTNLVHSKKDNQPNFVWIFADDYGYHDIGLRNPQVHTPNMDRLASKGVIFTNHYAQPVCSPSRHAFLTGRYPFKSALQNSVVYPHTPQCSGLEYKYLPEHLKELGYATHALGKWHLGYCRPECLPTHRGFDSYFGSYDGEGDYYTHSSSSGLYDWHEDDDVDFTANGTHSQDLVLDRALHLLGQQSKKKPFFLYLSPQNPHSPLQPKEEFLAPYVGLDLTEKRRNYLGLVTGLDHMVGEIEKKLESMNLMKKTYLMFVSDNGGDAHEANNLPFRAAKGTLFEGGTKTNSFVYSPLLKKTGYENDELIHLVDWLPTIVSMAGGYVSESEGIDGVNQRWTVKKGCASMRDTMVYNIDREIDINEPTFGEIAVRDTRYKLIWGMPGYYDGYGEDVDFIFNHKEYIDFLGERPSRKKRGGLHMFSTEQVTFLGDYMRAVRVTDQDLADGTGHMQLYDLKDDPTERNNLIDSTQPEHLEALQRLIKFTQDEITNGYKGMTPESRVHDVGANPRGHFETGWCNESLPLPATYATK